MDVSQFPKTEIHIHLDCSLSHAAVAAMKPGTDRATWRKDFCLEEKCEGLVAFLERVPRAIALLQSEAHLALAVDDLFAQFQRDNVIYAEFRFAPLQHLEAGLTPGQVVGAVERATAKAVARTGIEAGVILCSLRHFSPQQSLATARLAAEFKGSRVVGLDLAADEAGFSLDAHEAAFGLAREAGIGLTAHAGEACGPESVWETLRRLQPARIGHGVRAIEDPELLIELAGRGLHLEVCPSCNVLIDIYPEFADHPVDRLLRAGIPLSINCDGRALPHLNLNREYRRLHETFGWSAAAFLACNLNAVRAAFCGPLRKETLERRLRDGYRPFIEEAPCST